MQFKDLMTLRLTGIDGAKLTGTLRMKEVQQNNEVPDSRSEPQLTGKTSEFPLIDPVFDGSVLSFKIKSQGDSIQMGLKYAGGKLVWPGMNEYGAEPTTFTRIP
jgi:hypothetical protein